jgi:hypothetical protein
MQSDQRIALLTSLSVATTQSQTNIWKNIHSVQLFMPMAKDTQQDAAPSQERETHAPQKLSQDLRR